MGAGFFQLSEAFGESSGRAFHGLRGGRSTMGRRAARSIAVLNGPPNRPKLPNRKLDQAAASPPVRDSAVLIPEQSTVCGGSPAVEKALPGEESTSADGRSRRGLNRGEPGHRFSLPARTPSSLRAKNGSAGKRRWPKWPCGNKPSGETSKLVESSKPILGHLRDVPFTLGNVPSEVSCFSF